MGALSGVRGLCTQCIWKDAQSLLGTRGPRDGHRVASFCHAAFTTYTCMDLHNDGIGVRCAAMHSPYLAVLSLLQSLHLCSSNTKSDATDLVTNDLLLAPPVSVPALTALMDPCPLARGMYSYRCRCLC
jgi:hypothetical protein